MSVYIAVQLTAIEDDDSAYAYTYDNLSRVLQIDNDGTATGPNVVLYSTWDVGSRRSSVRAEVDSTDDFINTFAYDDLGRLVTLQQVAQQGGNSVEDKRVDFAYNANGQFSTIDRYADITQTDLVAGTTYTYDDAHRLTDLSHDKGTTNLADYSWTYDMAGRLTSVTNVHGTDDYSYDDDGQLTGVDSDYQTDESYTYDANGNRTNTGYTTGDNNRLTSDGTFNYTYDDEGNRTRKTNISTGDYVEYAWDHRNRLTTVTFKNSSNVKTKQVTYVYDMYDRRIAKDVDTDGNGTIDRGERYAYDGTNVALVYDRSDTLVERLLYGPGTDQPLTSEDASGNVLWFLADNQGTVRDVAQYNAGADTTAVVNHLTYGSFGNITSQTNSTYEPRHTYTGREWDADSNVFYYRARWYDPQAGRFLSEDPTGFAAGDANLSRYVGNSPFNYVDPSGNQSVDRDREDILNRAIEDDLASQQLNELFDMIDQPELNTPEANVTGPCGAFANEFNNLRREAMPQWDHLQLDPQFCSIDPPIRDWAGFLRADYHQAVTVTVTSEVFDPIVFYIDAGTHLRGDTTGNLGGDDNLFLTLPPTLVPSPSGIPPGNIPTWVFPWPYASPYPPTLSATLFGPGMNPADGV